MIENIHYNQNHYQWIIQIYFPIHPPDQYHYYMLLQSIYFQLNLKYANAHITNQNQQFTRFLLYAKFKTPYDQNTVQKIFHQYPNMQVSRKFQKLARLTNIVTGPWQMGLSDKLDQYFLEPLKIFERSLEIKKHYEKYKDIFEGDEQQWKIEKRQSKQKQIRQEGRQKLNIYLNFEFEGEYKNQFKNGPIQNHGIKSEDFDEIIEEEF